jgi:predicted transcriptional regulator
MVDPNICRHCGQKVQIPQYFGAMRQKIFEYVWKNPGHTAREITKAIYGDVQTTVVSVHLTQIKKDLEGTPYRLGGTLDPFHSHRPPCKYRIESIEGTRNVVV